jgi:hypothetical protein
VIVAVDEMHTPAITGILNQYGPLEIEERAAESRRRAWWLQPFSGRGRGALSALFFRHRSPYAWWRWGGDRHIGRVERLDLLARHFVICNQAAVEAVFFE